ncbi:MAG TPA: ComF family protein [Thermoguttaceae bacterium]
MTGLAVRVGSSLANFAAGALNLLFPPRCTFCNNEISDPNNPILLCPECCRRFVPEKWFGCRHCGGVILEEAQDADHCSMCRNPPLRFDTVVPLGGYHSILRDVILRMKQSQQAHLAVAMGRLLAHRRYSELSGLRADMVVPIPMYWSRRFQRGSNSPELLAHCLSRELDVPVHSRLLARTRNTLPQSGLPPKQRFRNVRGAFRICSHHPLQGARVLLVDDVLTTGATSSEVAKILKKAGASMVAVAVIARAQGGE